MKIKELKNGKFELNGSTIPNDLENTDYQKIQEWIKSGGEYEKFDYLKEAKDNKLAKLEAFILAKKTEPFTTHKAPEITGINPYTFGADVQFTWFVDAIPNSNLTPESILSKCTLDTVDCINAAINNSVDFASLKTNYANLLKQKVVPYSTTITKNGKELAGAINVFSVALTLANHIQQREIYNNIIKKTKTFQINACKSVEEVEAIKFES